MKLIFGFLFSLSTVAAPIFDPIFECIHPENKLVFQIYSEKEGTIRFKDSICRYVTEDIILSTNSRTDSRFTLYFKTADCRKNIYSSRGQFDLYLDPPYSGTLMVLNKENKNLSCNPKSPRDVEKLLKMLEKSKKNN